MRSLRLLVILAAVVLAPSVARADEPAVETTSRFAIGDPPTDLSLASDLGRGGIGASFGARYHHLQVGVGGSFSLEGVRAFVLARAYLFPNARIAPYVYGRVGRYNESEGFFDRGEPEKNFFWSGGVGATLHVTSEFYFFGEIGVDYERHTYGYHVERDYRVGLGARF